VSFEPHPLAVVKPELAPRLLAPGLERLEVLAELGVERLAILPFTRAFAEMSAEQFFDLVLRPSYGMEALVVGYDHGLGRGRGADADTLRRIGAERGIAVDVVPAVAGARGPVSSSGIRAAVAEGDLREVAAGLGRPYSLSGRVVRGAQRGRLLGYPTINLKPVSTRKLLPRTGVYAVMVSTPKGCTGGMMNLGPRPTFDDPEVALEVHLFEAEGDLYGAPVRIEFIERIRDTRRFDGAQALVAQLAEDEKTARRALTQVV
jgi:riboflavin kinase / FMN adenylyltransferase